MLNLGTKRSEIGPLVIDVDAFALFQEADRCVRDGRQQGFPTDLQNPLRDQDLDYEVVRPASRTPECERVENEAVDALPDDRASDGPGPEVLALGPDLHLGED